AAYLFNFAKFVEWPADTPPGALSVCFLNSPSVLGAFAASIADRRIGTRAVLARAVDEAGALHGCDMLYLGSGALGTSSESAEKVPAVLSVSEAQDFIHHGGIIELFAEGNRLRFRINLANAHRAGLRISSSLLQLASSVDQEQSP
ncbi:MAG: YfiR family protein, partial [Gammaproteobacteria bacterium]